MNSMDKKIKSNIDLINSFDEEILSIDNGKYIVNKKYKFGHIEVYNDSFFLSGEGDTKNTLIEKGDLLGANEGDFVLSRVVFNPRGKLKVKVVLIVEKSQNKTLVAYKNKDFISIKNGNKLDGKIIKNPKDGEIYLLEDSSYEFFGNLDNPKIDEKISLYLFKEDYRLDNYETKVSSKEIALGKRVDLTELDFCTIDPVGAKDHDDAIYYDYKNETLYVAIADVSHYIKEGSELDIEARKRAFSVYFPSYVLPMLPFVLSSDLCSLKPNEKRYAFVCKIKLDSKKLELKGSEFFEAVIESKNNFSYEIIDEKIEKNELPNELLELLLLTKRLREKRLEHGYNFRNEEFKMHLNESGELSNIEASKSTFSHQLVEECMLLANQEAAKKIGNVGIFRIHEEPDMKKIDKLMEELASIGLNVKKKKDIHSTISHIQKEATRFFLEKEVDKMIIKAQQQAKYSNHLGDHFGLGFSHYSHFTSPIRRYSDLTLHRILKGDKIPKDIEQICEEISNTERQIAKMVWDLEGRKYARWAVKNLNIELKGNICDVGDVVYGELIEVMCGLKFEIKNYKGEKLYNKVRIVLTEVDIISKKIFGQIIR